MRIGRLLGGLGGAAAAISNKYIDDEIAQQRQQALLDMQHASRVRTEEWEQSPEVQGRRVDNELTRARRVAEEDLRAKTEEASNPALRQARIDARVDELRQLTPAQIEAANAVERGTAPVKLESEQARREAMDPMDIDRERRLADVRGRTEAKYRPGEKTLDQRLKDTEQALGRELTKQEREQIVLGLKPFDDSVQVVESVDPITGETTTKRTWRERPGQGGRSEPQALTAGTVVDGFVYRGGDPKDKSSWSKAPSGGGDKKDSASVRNNQQTADPLEQESDLKLARIARIPGHVNQERAMQILAQRKRARGDGEPTNIAAEISAYIRD